MFEPISRNYFPKRTISPNSFVLFPTDNKEIENIIGELKTKKSVGIDEIKAETIKTICAYILEPLTYIINLCMERGIWPRAFKEAVVVPIFKKGDETLITNYRPISLITHLTKVFEKILKKG